MNDKKCCTKLKSFFKKWSNNNKIDEDNIEWHTDISADNFYSWKFEINNKVHLLKCYRESGNVVLK